MKCDIINWSHNVIEFQVWYCTACRHSQEVNVRFLKLYWQKIFTQSLVNDATACYWLQSLEVSGPRLESLWGARGNVSTDEPDSSSDNNVTMCESGLIYILNNDKLICKFLCDKSKHWSMNLDTALALYSVGTIPNSSKVKALLKLAPTEMNQPEYAVISLPLVRKILILSAGVYFFKQDCWKHT